MKLVLVFFCALAAFTLWTGLIVPLIANLFGIRLKYAFWRIDRCNQHLPRRQFFWFVGVLSFGGGLSVLFLLSDFLQWKFLAEKTRDIRYVYDLVIPLIAGAIFGSGRAPKEDTGAEAPR